MLTVGPIVRSTADANGVPFAALFRSEDYHANEGAAAKAARDWPDRAVNSLKPKTKRAYNQRG